MTRIVRSYSAKAIATRLLLVSGLALGGLGLLYGSVRTDSKPILSLECMGSIPVSLS